MNNLESSNKLKDLICECLYEITLNQNNQEIDSFPYVEGVGVEKFIYSPLGAQLAKKICQVAPELMSRLKLLGGGNVNLVLTDNSGSKTEKNNFNAKDKDIDFIVACGDEIYFIEIKGPSGYDYIFGGSNSATNKYDEENFYSEELLKIYHNCYKQLTGRDSNKEKIRMDSIWGDVYKLEQMIKYCSNSKGGKDKKFFGICVGYIKLSTSKQKTKETIKNCFKEMFEAYKGSKKNAKNTKYNLTYELLECPNNLIVLIVCIN